MSVPRLIYPMLDGFLLGDEMSSHDGVRCYPAIQRSTEEKYILKVISVPASAVQLEALLITGAVSDQEAARSYFYKQAEEILHQADLLRQMSHQEGFVPYLDAQIVSKENGIGYDVYLLGNYKQSVEKIFRTQQLTQLGVVHMGLDLCAALAACRRAGHLFVDLQPGNIFYSQEQGYRIGDLGFASLASLEFSSLAKKYHSRYTAPEMQDDFAVLNATLDVYALGLVLYQAYNGGQLDPAALAPGQSMMPPMYADYEMAEILFKACDPDPAKRWQDPTELAQALVAYMQRNEIEDIPLIPAPVEEIEEEPEPFLPEADPEELQKEMDALEPEQDLAFMTQQAQEESEPQETDQLLAQAEELIAHELPAPAVAPEPVEIPMPEPIVLEEEEAEPGSPEEEQEAESECEEAACPEEAEAEEEEEEQEPQVTAEMPAEIEEKQEAEEEKAPFRFPRKLAIGLIILLLLAGCIWGGIHYYNHTYLQNIDDLILMQQDDMVTVQVVSHADERLLTVVCSDSYGNLKTQPVTAGVAVFTDLDPQTRYTVRVLISGNHKLTGNTSQSFSTPARTHILSFTAGIGQEDGSVLLTLSTTGPEVSQWIVTYSTEGEAPRHAQFSGIGTQLTGLTVGKTYTFTLSTPDGRKLAGQNQVSYTATNILLAQDLQITACGAGILTVQWRQPEEGFVESWTIHCYNANGFDQIVTTTDLSYTFTGLSHDVPCTVDVTAAGMQQCATVKVDANPISIQEFTASVNERGELVVSWMFTGNAPENGWQFIYRINDSQEIRLDTAETTVVIPAIADATYQFRLEAGGQTVFGGEGSHTTAPAQAFQGYGVGPENTQWQLCLRPAQEEWTYADVDETDYRSTFTAAEMAALLIRCEDAIEVCQDVIYIHFVITDAQGAVVHVSSSQAQWDQMWLEGCCTLDLPPLPQTPGSYTLTVYWNGMLANSQNFTIA